MEKKQTQRKSKQSIDTSKNTELVFTESKKEPCDTCKEPKVVNNPLLKYTKEEMDLAMTLVERRDITPQQMQWLIGLNNRVLNDKKQYGCGKCHIQVLKNLKNAYHRLYGNL
jgi:hypothetical protein